MYEEVVITMRSLSPEVFHSQHCEHNAMNNLQIPCAAEASFVPFLPFFLFKYYKRNTRGACLPAFSCISAIQPCCAYPQKRVLTPGLPHAYPVPVVCLPRNGPPLSRCLGAQPCCPCLQKRRCLPLAPPVLPPSWQCA